MVLEEGVDHGPSYPLHLGQMLHGNSSSLGLLAPFCPKGVDQILELVDVGLLPKAGRSGVLPVAISVQLGLLLGRQRLSAAAWAAAALGRTALRAARGGGPVGTALGRLGQNDGVGGCRRGGQLFLGGEQDSASRPPPPLPDVLAASPIPANPVWPAPRRVGGRRRWACSGGSEGCTLDGMDRPPVVPVEAPALL